MDQIVLEKLTIPSSLLPLPEDADAEFVQEAAEDGEGFYAIRRDGGTVGAALAHQNQNAFLYICIFPKDRRRGYAGAAAALLERKLAAGGAQAIQTCWRTEEPAGAALAQRRGYALRYTSSYMVYRGGPTGADRTGVRPYGDGDYDTAHGIYALAFHRMRLRTGRFPDSVPAPATEQSRREWAETAADRVVLELEGQVAGVAHLEGNMIGSVAIRPELQGRGLGRRFVSCLVDLLLERGHEEIGLYCLSDNTGAGRLYGSLGFQAAYRNGYGARSV